MSRQFSFLDFLKTGIFSGAGWTALVICCYVLLNYAYYSLLFSHENSVVFGLGRFLTFVLLLIGGMVINGAIGLGLGVILGLISYGIFPRPQEVERVYQVSLFIVSMVAVLILGSFFWAQALCVIVGSGRVYIEAVSFVMMMNFIVFGRICHHCSSAYLKKAKAKIVRAG